MQIQLTGVATATASAPATLQLFVFAFLPRTGLGGGPRNWDSLSGGKGERFRFLCEPVRLLAQQFAISVCCQ